ncbi:hypothetical protein K435DRAFT_846859 [Dendrothele bispora CBS 962.96]|uniref:Uncharacterized protein n=1 Tax=Dendrothele bispora (strain CBS 962.96) TaxID=1314807 RepID=A0A4S8KJV7_DENBC|nr:hypothetical protein K435DRAFT_846859 [Dendrothele bispora CBS 962.96]
MNQFGLNLTGFTSRLSIIPCLGTTNQFWRGSDVPWNRIEVICGQGACIKPEDFSNTCWYPPKTLAPAMEAALLNPSTVISQPDNTQSEAVTQDYTLIVLAVLFCAAVAVIRLRYPCLTSSGLKEFVDKLDDMVQRFTEDGGSVTYFSIDISSLRRNIDEIEHEKNNNIFLWSSVYRYLRYSFIVLRKIVKCYDEARELQVSILASGP